MKSLLKILILIIFSSLFLTGCSFFNDQGSEEAGNRQNKTLNYIDEHITLEKSYNAVTINNDMLYGSYVNNDEIRITYQNKNTGEIIKEVTLPLSAKEVYVQNMCVNNYNEIYIFANNYQETQNYSYMIDSSGYISEIETFTLEDTEHARWITLKELKTDNKGNLYLWYEMAIPIVDSEKTGIELSNPIYTLVNRVYVKDTQLNPLFYIQTDNIIGLELANNGNPAIFYEEDNVIFTDHIDMKRGELSGEPINLTDGITSNSNVCNKFALTEDGFLFCMNGTIYEYLYSDKKYKKLFTLSSYGILADNLLYLGTDGMSIELVDNYHKTNISELIRLREGEDAKTTITLGLMITSAELEDLVANFNRYSTSSRVELQTYYDESEDYDSCLEQLKLDLIKGEAPDIIELNSIDYAPFIDKGILVDLYSFMEDDTEFNKEHILESVRKAYEIDNHLYSISPAFVLHSMWGSQKHFGNETGLSLNELILLLKSKGKTLNAIYGFSADEPVLTTLCTFGMNEFLNWENNTCDFTGNDFKDLLKFAKEYNGGFSDGSLSIGLQKEEILLSVGIIKSVTDYQIQAELFEDDLTYIGYPTSRGSGTAISYHGSSLGLNATSNNQDLAWEFIRYFFLNGYNGGGFPVHVAQFSTAMEEAKEIEIISTEEGQYKLVKGIYSDGDSYIEILQAKQADVDKIISLITTADCRYEYNTDIMNIINEESEAYFRDQKTLDDVCNIIQRRISIYMNE